MWHFANFAMDPVEILIKKYNTLEKNGTSLRDFSRFLDIHPSTLSKILARKRGIPKGLATKLATKLLEKEDDQLEFVKSILNYKNASSPLKTKTENVRIIDDHKSMDTFVIISQWEYFAILNVIGLKNFDHSYDFIAQSLGISIKRVVECINVLKRNDLIEVSESKIVRTAQKISSTSEVSSRALKLAHLEELELAKGKINLPIERRNYQSHVVKVSEKDLPKIRKLIEKFYADLDKIADEAEPEEVFCLNTQLFPLTQKILPKKGLRNNEH